MYDKSQLLKGVLEGCILKILQEKDNYGYGILSILNASGFSTMKEGSVYPVLTRLEKKGYIKSILVPSSQGPSRKSYSLTEEGLQYYKDFLENWEELSLLVNNLLYDKK